MIATHLLFADVLQEAVGNAPDAMPAFSIGLLGKSLITISFSALLVLSLSARAVWRMLRGSRDDYARIRSTVDGVLFWGVFAFVLGVFHTFMGLIMTFLSVASSAPVLPEEHEVIATGVAIGLGAGAYGSVVCLLAGLLWLWLRHWLRRGGFRRRRGVEVSSAGAA